ncbi:MAG: VacJ family lipoprotein [Rhodospirillaceae bacterium]
MIAGVTGCATPPADPAARAEFEQMNDPMEPANRYIFEVNRFLDFIFFKPWADTYRRIVPDFGRERVHDALRNMGEPVDFANEMLQGRVSDGATSVGRFIVNSVIGLGGLFDVATEMGLPSKEGDFGQTLYTWGVTDGPYVVMPIFGPATLRDAFGMGVDMAGDPVSWSLSFGGLSPANYGRAGVGGLDIRSEYIDPMEALEKTSIDFYAQVRSMVRQRRAKELSGQAVPESLSYPSFDFYNAQDRSGTAGPK